MPWPDEVWNAPEHELAQLVDTHFGALARLAAATTEKDRQPAVTSLAESLRLIETHVSADDPRPEDVVAISFRYWSPGPNMVRLYVEARRRDGGLDELGYWQWNNPSPDTSTQFKQRRQVEAPITPERVALMERALRIWVDAGCPAEDG